MYRNKEGPSGTSSISKEGAVVLNLQAPNEIASIFRNIDRTASRNWRIHYHCWRQQHKSCRNAVSQQTERKSRCRRVKPPGKLTAVGGDPDPTWVCWMVHSLFTYNWKVYKNGLLASPWNGHYRFPVSVLFWVWWEGDWVWRRTLSYLDHSVHAHLTCYYSSLDHACPWSLKIYSILEK